MLLPDVNPQLIPEAGTRGQSDRLASRRAQTGGTKACSNQRAPGIVYLGPVWPGLADPERQAATGVETWGSGGCCGQRGLCLCVVGSKGRLSVGPGPAAVGAT